MADSTVDRSSPSARARSRWLQAGIVLAAAGLGIAAAALVADGASADRAEPPAATPTVRPVPVLAAGPRGSALSEAVSQYAVTAFADPTRGLVLAGWGAAFTDLFDDPVPGSPRGSLVDDPRLRSRDGEPAFSDPCAADPVGPGCPDAEDVVPAVVLGDSPLGPNAVVVHAFPQPDADLADECAFGDVTDGELPIAVITANPGQVEVVLDGESVTVDSDEQEIAEFEAWRESGAPDRPPSSFVAHCLAVPRPGTSRPVLISAVAVDGDGQAAVATTSVLPSAADRLPPSVTPIDGTMVRVDVPLPAGVADAEVRTLALDRVAGPVPACADLAPGASPPAGWRSGSSVLVSDPAAAGGRPYLAGFPRVRRITVALPEGEPTLVCVVGTGPDPAPAVGVVVTPPDARRLRLAVSEVDAAEALDAGDVEVTGIFAALGWAPCGATLPAVPSGVTALGDAGWLCESGGDTGAIAAAGGVLDLVVASGPAATHRVRIALSASPGGPEVEAYRLPIPAPGFDGVLCTVGTDQPGCVEPEGDVVLGSVLVTATWDEGPVGPAGWSIEPEA